MSDPRRQRRSARERSPAPGAAAPAPACSSADRTAPTCRERERTDHTWADEPGTVYLVGAGPGDPDLLTIRGRQCLREADTVVYDYLANPVLLDLAVHADEHICVGKKAGKHTMTQAHINALLVAKSRDGRRTVRLKGGDPFVFGRGGEEALALAAAGIPFEIVPGITAGIAAPAYAGIPVTHRDCNSVLTLVTGHEDPAKAETAVNWPALAQGGGTLVFYMGVRNLPGIVARLTAHGRPGHTPVAVIQRGTEPAQQVVAGTLASIVAQAQQAGLRPPAVIVVGEVAALRQHLRWFDARALSGKTVLVTRARSQAGTFARQLEQAGAAVIQVPTIRIEPPTDWTALEAAVSDPGAYEWILFTSVNGVEFFFRALTGTGGDSRSLGSCRVAALGSATAEALLAHGIAADLVPERFTAAALYQALHDAGQVDGNRFLLPRSDIAPDRLAERLTAAGGRVTAVTAYRTTSAEPAEPALAALRKGQVDLVTFTSSSTARNFAAMMRKHLGALPANMAYASIGPETTRTARAEGMDIAVEADPHTVPGLVRAITLKFRAAPDNARAAAAPVPADGIGQ